MLERVGAVEREAVRSECVFTGAAAPLPCRTLVLVTQREPCTELAPALDASLADPASPLRSVQTIGDALAPGLIADAVFSGHLAAQDFQREPAAIEAELYRRERPTLPGGEPTREAGRDRGIPEARSGGRMPTRD